MAHALVSSSLLDKMTDVHNLKESLFLAQGFRGISQWSAGSKAEVSWLKGRVEKNYLPQAARSRENARECQTGRGQGSDIVPKVTIP